MILVDLAALFVLLVADPGFDQDHGGASAHDDRIQSEQNAVLWIGGRFLLPERLGNYAEHGSAVQSEGAVGGKGQLEIAERTAAAKKEAV